MEYIEGETLGARIRRGPPLSLAAVKALSRQLLLGLGAAHAAGVLHRDFKSDNVMLRTRPAQAEGWDAVILDFGLARVLDHDYQGLTERHEFLGSAGYMAPEQLLEGEPLSEATDLYAFGVVLFEMLTQRLPFQGRSARAVAFQRLVQSAPPPSSVVPGLSAEWDALVARCLQREAAQRFASARAVLEQLEAIGNGKPAELAATPRKGVMPASAAPESVSQREVLDTAKPTVSAASKGTARRPLLLLLLAGAAALGLSVLWQQGRSGEPALVEVPQEPPPSEPHVPVPVLPRALEAAAQPALETSRLAARPAASPVPLQALPAAPASAPSPAAAARSDRKASSSRPPEVAEGAGGAPGAAGADIRKRFYVEPPDEQ
jgi:serine/threonine protein kinase